MTLAEFVEQNTPELREKTLLMLRREFPKSTREDAEDIYQGVLIICLKHLDKLTELAPSVTEKCKLEMIDKLNTEGARREGLKGYFHRTYDPQRRLDYKIDLESAIRKSVRGDIQRKAAWHVLYEGYTVEEVAAMLPTYKAQITWFDNLRLEILPSVRRTMKRMGYRRIG